MPLAMVFGELSLPSEGDDAVAGNRVHLDELNVDRGLRALAADEGRLVREGGSVKRSSGEEVDRRRGVAEMVVREEVVGMLRSKSSQGQDEVVDDLMGSDCGNAFIRRLLDQGKGAGGGEGRGGQWRPRCWRNAFRRCGLGLTKKRIK